MTQEDKELLLKDLSARLPYNVKIHIKGEYKTPHTIFSIYVEDKTVGYFKGLQYNEEFIKNIKPYLRPMSSMTEEEKEEFNKIKESVEAKFINAINDDGFTLAYYELIDWLNKHHFDYRGLIFRGLALEAKDGMYNNNIQ